MDKVALELQRAERARDAIEEKYAEVRRQQNWAAAVRGERAADSGVPFREGGSGSLGSMRAGSSSVGGSVAKKAGEAADNKGTAAADFSIKAYPGTSHLHPTWK